LLLVFSLPFDRIPSIEIAGVSLRSSLIIGVAVILRALYLILIKKTKIKFLNTDKIILAFLVWIVLIVPESINIARAANVVVFNIFVVLLAFSVSVIFNKKYIKPLIYALFISCGISIVFAAYQYIGDLLGLSNKYTGLLDRYTWSVFGFPRVQSFSLEPLYYASYLLIPFSLSLALVFVRQKIVSTRLAYFILAMSGFAIFMTVSRGGIYGLLASTAAVLIYVFIYKPVDYKKHSLWVLTLVLSGFLLSLLVINYLNKPISAKKAGANAYIEQVKKTGLSEGDERSVARREAINLLNENKSAYVVGIGPGQYGPYIQNNRGEGWTIVNNLPLELLLETGIFGLILVVAFFANIFFKGFSFISRSNQAAVSVLALSMCAYLVSQAVQYQSFSTLYVVHIWVATGLLWGITRNK